MNTLTENQLNVLATLRPNRVYREDGVLRHLQACGLIQMVWRYGTCFEVVLTPEGERLLAGVSAG